MYFIHNLKRVWYQSYSVFPIWNLCETGIFLLLWCDYNTIRIVRVTEAVGKAVR